MEDSHLISFEIKGFKKFSYLNIDNVGQFNLIVGDNNVGKTTLLEALLINPDYNKFANCLKDIMVFVKKYVQYQQPFFHYYFSDSPTGYPQKMGFRMEYNGHQVDNVEFLRTNFQTFDLYFSGNTFGNGNIPKIQFDIINSFEYNINNTYIPFGPLYTHELTRQYSNSVQKFSTKKEKLIESLRHIIPNITNLEVSLSDLSQPLLLIAEKGKEVLSPIASYGDGTIKLFRILLSLLSNDTSKRLMIDEIDSGVHYSRLKEFLKSLLSVAKGQKKQIFATTHSKECIEYFTAALKETGFQQDGRIIRLAETKSGIKAYTNTFEQFENDLKADSELR